jgi:hypothetical protein
LVLKFALKVEERKPALHASQILLDKCCYEWHIVKELACNIKYRLGVRTNNVWLFAAVSYLYYVLNNTFVFVVIYLYVYEINKRPGRYANWHTIGVFVHFSTFFLVNSLEVCNEMTVSHGGEYEDDSHLGYCAVLCKLTHVSEELTASIIRTMTHSDELSPCQWRQ